MAWRKNPSDFQWEKDIMQEVPPPTDAAATAAAGDDAPASLIATSPRDDEDDDGVGKNHTDETASAKRDGVVPTTTTGAPTTTAATSTNAAEPPTDGTTAVPPPIATNTSHDDGMSQLTSSEIDASDTHTLTSQTSTASHRLTTATDYVKEVLSDTLQILQGVPPPQRHYNSNADGDDDPNNNNNYNNGTSSRMDPKDLPDHFIILKDEIREIEDDDADLNKNHKKVIHNKKQRSVAFRKSLSNASSSDTSGDEQKEPLDFLQDDPKLMTIGRRIALTLMKYKWYNPAVATTNVQEEEEEAVIVEEQKESNHAAATPTEATTTTSINNHATTPTNHDNKATTTSTIITSAAAGPAAKDALSSSQHRPPRPNAPPTVTALEYPSLAKAWAYFEHVTLPRYFIPDRDPAKRRKSMVIRAFRRVFCKAQQALDRAEPGESSAPTKLYDPIFTPLKQMGDFGLGIGLYFSTLRAMMFITFFAGIINIPNFKYFAGPFYSDYPGRHRQTNSRSNIPKLQQGSAICPAESQVWVPCMDCRTTPSKYLPRSRLALATVTAATNVTTTTTSINGTNISTTQLVVGELSNVTFALRNFCDGATTQQGLVNYGTLWFFMIGILLLNWYLQKMEVKFDEDEQTAQDYSMVITNPPPDATDPNEWKLFLETNFQHCHVTVCTVAVDNDLLVRSLVERREKMKRIEMLVDAGTVLDDISLSNIAARTERERKWYQHWLALIVPGIPELFGRVVVLTAKVQGLAQQEYPASNVFVSFETEAAQRHVLKTLSVGALVAKRNDGRVLPDPCYMFRGVHVLQVEEAEEPNTIRWQDLNAPFIERSKALFWTTVATLAAIALIAFIVQVVNATGAVFAAFAIAIFNAVFPIFAKLLTSLESHPAEGQKQTSLYFKIALFRWVNTAIVYTIIRPFTSTLDAKTGIIPSVYAQFFAEIFTSNVIQLGDPLGHVQRHLLAPRAKSQDAMNLNMQGANFELAERYTNMTKLVFLAMWYCAIYPGAFFMCAFALLVNYFVDRFSLFRTWKPAPHLGTSISKFSRNYFFSLAVVAMAVVCSYYWSAFPFDNLCPITSDDDGVNQTYIYSVSSIQQLKEDNVTLTGTKNDYNLDHNYRYCLQDLIRSHRVKVFPFTPASQPPDNKWMTDDQKFVTNIYGWTSVAIVGIVILSFLYRWWESLQGLFKSTYSPCGEDQGINFSEVPSMNTYIPQVASPVFGYPLLATNITGLDTGLLEWTDPDREFEFYDLTKDAERLLRGTDISSKVVFSQVKHWPPPRKRKSKRKSSIGNNSTSGNI